MENHDAGVAWQRELEFLFGRLNYERAPEQARSVQDFKLARMGELLQRLGDPQLTIPCVHVTGSKGKGSTATMIARVLEDAGHRTGLFTSPHLHDFRERITVNGQLAVFTSLLPLMERIRLQAHEMDQQSHWGGPTFFELTTALGWLYFQQQQVDYVVLEVGLGGRLDSTNLCAPLVTVITSISHDHNRLLGPTLADIAREKGGIIKSRVPVVFAIEDPAARAVVHEIAARWRAPVTELHHTLEIRWEALMQPHMPFPCPAVTVSHSGSQQGPYQLALPGAHQAANGALAVAVVNWLRTAGLRIPEAAVASGLRRAVLPGRMQITGQQPLVVCDVAHNEASVRALCNTLASCPARCRRVIFSASRDKHVGAMLRVLNEFADELWLTQYQENPRAVPLAELEKICQEVGLTVPIRSVAQPREALQQARNCSQTDDLILATGSLFLIAELT